MSACGLSEFLSFLYSLAKRLVYCVGFAGVRESEALLFSVCCLEWQRPKAYRLIS